MAEFRHNAIRSALQRYRDVLKIEDISYINPCVHPPPLAFEVHLNLCIFIQTVQLHIPVILASCLHAA